MIEQMEITNFGVTWVQICWRQTGIYSPQNQLILCRRINK